MDPRTITAIAAAALTGLLLTGCAATATESTPGSAQAIARALNTAGFTCTAYTDNPEAIGPTTAGTCTHGDRTIDIATFDSPEQLQRITRQAAQAFDQPPPSPDPYGTTVTGPTWTVTSTVASDAATIQKILGGQRQ